MGLRGVQQPPLPPCDDLAIPFAIDALPPKPIIGVSKPFKSSLQGQVSIPSTAKIPKKGKELIEKANNRIKALDDALTASRNYGDLLLTEAKAAIDSVYKSSQQMHKKLSSSLQASAVQKTKCAELSRDNKTAAASLREARQENKDLTTLLNATKKKYKKTLQEVEQLKEEKEKRKQQVSNAKSPGTIAAEKSRIRIEEHKQKKEHAQMMKERDRQDDYKAREQRMKSIQSSFQVDSMGDGKFVSICFYLFYCRNASNI